jgi:hypothetical protein
MVKKVSKKTITETIDDDGSKKTVVKEHAPKSSDTKKKTTATKKKTDSDNKKMSAKEREELLIQNFVGLQHAMTNMSIKFGVLTDNISKLLSVFEEAAKGFVVGDKQDDTEMLGKIDSLLDQNKTIAKGLVLMEERVRTRVQNAKEAEKTMEEAKKANVNPPRREGDEKRHESSDRPGPPRNGLESRGDNSNLPPMRPKPLPRI